ncbi:MAG TPA: peptidase [Burkholderiaceae bacterium]|nr:peptidase [Burkholderiaceae bacterium]
MSSATDSPMSLARLFTVCAMLLALAAPAWADVSRDQAAAAAQRQTGGRVLSIDKTEVGRRIVWRVKVVTPRGEVRVVFIDADAGRGG